MEFSKINYKGFKIEKRIDVKSNTCIVYGSNDFFKCIAGDVLKDGSENSIEKAKKFINSISQ